MDTQTLLNKLDTAYKAITTTDMGQGLLTERKQVSLFVWYRIPHRCYHCPADYR